MGDLDDRCAYIIISKLNNKATLDSAWNTINEAKKRLKDIKKNLKLQGLKGLELSYAMRCYSMEKWIMGRPIKRIVL